MATAAPSPRNVDKVIKDLAAQTKRVDDIVGRLNGILQGAKDNDDRIEKTVLTVVAKLNESLLSAKKNDDRLEAMIKALEAKVDKLGKK